ncbi:myosin-2 heavy chain, non muscle-like [Haliotis asinina]|uniref:myosin-2 heavy chain, non muscle-like n=1 Tax=Haliotis asinina TaxID=109174 RepID=UPI00353222CA
MSGDAKKDLIAEARSFSASLSNVFLMKKRDQQTRHLLEKAQNLLEGLLAENQRLSSNTGTPRQTRGGGMGQLWVKLDEMKRENEDLRRQLGRHDDRSTPTKNMSHGPGDVIIADLQKTKTENEALRNQVESLQKTVKELQNITATVQDEYKRAKIGLEAAQKSMEKARHEYRSLEANLTSAKTENDSLKQKLTSSVKPMVRADNRLTENINERCRPSVIAMRYNTLESQEWMDAKESLEDSSGMDEEEITRFLCSSIMQTYEASREVYQCLELAIGELLRRPALAVSIAQGGMSSEPTQLPEEMTDAIRSRLRQNCDSIDSGELIKITKNTLEREFKDVKGLISNKAVNRYLHESARLTWQMAIQQPPMKMSITDKRYNDERHKLWWSCDQARASSINHFIWPVLFDYDGGNLMVKGCVFAS